MITVGIIDSRSKINQNWVEQCISSIQSSIYRDIELIVVDNTEKKYTIAKCRNKIAKLSKADWVLYIDDDDYISPEYIAGIVDFINKSDTEDLVMVTTSSIFVYEDTQELRDESPIGCWKRTFLLENPFDEGLLKYEDIDLLERAKSKGLKTAKLKHLAGYFYRQHDTMNSSRKLMRELKTEIDNILRK